MMRKLRGPNKKNKPTQKSPGNRDDEEFGGPKKKKKVHSKRALEIGIMRISLKSSGKWDEEKQWQYQKEKKS